MFKIAVVSCVVSLVTGCAQPAAPSGPPPRPPELDRFDAWVGEWDSTADVTPAGATKSLQSTGHESVTWEAGKRFLLERFTYKTGSEPEDTGLVVRTWDPKTRLYRSWYFDNSGTVGHSKMTYDEKSSTWHMTTKGHDPATGQPTAGESTLKFLDANTLEWTFTEWDRSKLHKLVDMKGTSRKK